METYKDLPVLAFETPAAWRAWLDEHHTTSGAVWLRLFKKASGRPTVTYAEALDEALCYGWIDSQKAAGDDHSFLQRFGPRKLRSLWSAVNREHIARLTTAGKMQPAGLAAVEEARRNGQWEAAYDSPARATVPEDFSAALARHPEARAFFEGLNQTNRYAFLWRIQTAKKAETRAKRIEWAIDKLAKGEKLH